MKRRKRIIRAILEEIIKVLWLLPVKKNKMLFYSFQGKQFSDSPKYLSEYIKKNSDYEIYWTLNDLRKFKSLSENGYKIVKYGSFKFILHFVTSKVIVTNDSVKSFLPVRKNQILLNTWHGGSPLKTIGFAMSSTPCELSKELNIFNKKYSAYVSSSKFMTDEVFRKSLSYRGTILEYGMPRNAILLSEHTDIKEKVYTHFELNKDKHIVLYAPTFRDSNNGPVFLSENQKLNVEECLNALKKRFGQDFCFLFRAHHTMKERQNEKDVIYATDYPDMQELLCAADVLITDYSSCMGDMVLMYKPVFLYAPDLDSYIKDRGFYWDIHTLPFPLAETKESLADEILNFDEQKYEKEVDDYFEKLGSFESKESIEKVCNWLFQNMKTKS